MNLDKIKCEELIVMWEYEAVKGWIKSAVKRKDIQTIIELSDKIVSSYQYGFDASIELLKENETLINKTNDEKLIQDSRKVLLNKFLWLGSYSYEREAKKYLIKNGYISNSSEKALLKFNRYMFKYLCPDRYNEIYC